MITRSHRSCLTSSNMEASKGYQEQEPLPPLSPKGSMRKYNLRPNRATLSWKLNSRRLSNLTQFGSQKNEYSRFYAVRCTQRLKRIKKAKQIVKAQSSSLNMSWHSLSTGGGGGGNRRASGSRPSVALTDKESTLKLDCCQSSEEEEEISDASKQVKRTASEEEDKMNLVTTESQPSLCKYSKLSTEVSATDRDNRVARRTSRINLDNNHSSSRCKTMNKKEPSSKLKPKLSMPMKAKKSTDVTKMEKVLAQELHFLKDYPMRIHRFEELIRLTDKYLKKDWNRCLQYPKVGFLKNRKAIQNFAAKYEFKVLSGALRDSEFRRDVAEGHYFRALGEVYRRFDPTALRNNKFYPYFEGLSPEEKGTQIECEKLLGTGVAIPTAAQGRFSSSSNSSGYSGSPVDEFNIEGALNEVEELDVVQVFNDLMAFDENELSAELPKPCTSSSVGSSSLVSNNNSSAGGSWMQCLPSTSKSWKSSGIPLSATVQPEQPVRKKRTVNPVVGYFDFTNFDEELTGLEPSEEESAEHRMNLANASFLSYPHVKPLFYAGAKASVSLHRRLIRTFPFVFNNEEITDEMENECIIHRGILSDDEIISISEQILDNWDDIEAFFGEFSEDALEILEMAVPFLEESRLKFYAK